MATDHDEFILEFGIRSWNFGDGVEAVLVIAGELSVDVEFNGDRNIGSQEPVNAPVILNSSNRDRQRIAAILLVDHPAKACAGVVEHGAAGATVVAAVAAGGEHGEGLFGSEEFADFLAKLQFL